jgi:two-component system chemotaxis sensor kinase CheA
MGDGRIAMILDAPGVAALANLRFGDINEAELAMTRHADDRRKGETQSLLLFRNASKDLLTVNLDMVARIEKVKAADLERIGNREFLKYRESSLRVIRLQDFLPLSAPEEEPEWLYVIVPKLVKHPMGIIASQVVDVLETTVKLDRDNLAGAGILGSAIIDGNMTVFIDIYGLFEQVDPQIYGTQQNNAGDFSGKRILLAEDTEFFRLIESQYLQSFTGLQSDVVENGEEAWDLLNKQTYDLLLTDIEMPEMDGFELAGRVRASDKFNEMPIVALTALSAERYQERGSQAGIDGYEIKLDKEKLTNTIREFLLKGRAAAQHTSSGSGQEQPSAATTDELLELDKH